MQLNLFSADENTQKSTKETGLSECKVKDSLERNKISSQKPLEKCKGLSGDIVSNTKDRIKMRNHCMPEDELKQWIESDWHQGVFDDNTGYDVAMLILMDVPTNEIMELFNGMQV